jgi:hypothetical protein
MTTRAWQLLALCLAIAALAGSVGFVAGASARDDDRYGPMRGPGQIGPDQRGFDQRGFDQRGPMMNGNGSGRLPGPMGPQASVSVLPGTGPVTAEQARAQAQAWVDRYAAGATLDAGTPMPRGYRFTASRNAQVVAVVMVDDDTGTAVGHGDITTPPPSPAASART